VRRIDSIGHESADDVAGDTNDDDVERIGGPRIILPTVYRCSVAALHEIVGRAPSPPRHHASEGPRIRPIAAARRRHCAVPAVSCRRPVLVTV
jgi:hypothetical protein